MSITPTSAVALLARATTTTTSASSTSTSASAASTRPPAYHVVGIILAISSGLFIGVSFVIKKVGLLKANKKYNEEAGDGFGYLKNAWWWLGMTLMIIGEICNFVAYAFVDAILVTPMGSLSVVVTTILSAIFLKERLSFVGKIGCFLCIVGSVIIVLNAPEQSAVADIQEMQRYVITPGFLTYAGVLLVGCGFIAFWAGPRYGKKSMLVYLSVCSLIGGLSVVATQGLGAAIIAQIGGEKQFNQWFLYVLFVFVICTLLTEIVYLNKALNIFNAALVTPTYYVYFTSATIVTSAILFQGFKGTPQTITTIVMGFLVICGGVVLLQLSKSAKDVPDTAVFKGDLDQVRTIAEQEESEAEPKADAIRGGAAILRSISTMRQRRETEEVKRIHDERLEPIGENEQVEWDGLRRRKTIIAPGTPSIRRQKSIHPPLGMSHFPDEQSEADTHNPEDDFGILPNFRRRAHTILSRKSGTGSETSSQIDPKSDRMPHTMAMYNISPNRNGTYGSDQAGSDVDLSSSKPHVYGMPDSLKRESSIGLSHLHGEDTTYRSPGVGGTTLTWAPEPPHTSSSRHLATPSPDGGRPSPGSGKRQFSFQNVFTRSPRADNPSPDRGAERPTSARTTSTNSSFPRRVLSSMGRNLGGRTEEERLGLVTGDSHSPYETSPSRVQGGASASGAAPDPAMAAARRPAEYGRRATTADGQDDYDTRQGRGRRHDFDDYEDEYDRAAFEESPERIESEEGYARVRRKSDDDDYGGGPLAKGRSFL